MTSIVDQVITHLTGELSNYATVEKAWSMAPIENYDNKVPGALVYIGGIVSESSGYDSQHYQPGERLVHILLAVPTVDFESRWKEVMDAMAGFQPAGGAFESFEHVNGDAVEIDGDLLWWRDVYSVQCYRGEI